MARFKKPKGQTPVSKVLKKKLTTKQSYGKSTSLNESSSGSVGEKPVQDVRLSSGITHFARKSTVGGNKFDSHVARKSIGSGNQFQNPKARKSTGVDPFARKSTDADPESGNVISGPHTRSIPPVAPKKNTRKSKNHLRPLAAIPRNHRRKSGVFALQQIRYYQKQVGFLIPKLSFQRVVKEILGEFSSTVYRVQSDALAALQEAAEMYLVRKFEDGQLCAIHANRVTLLNRDFTLLKYLQD